MTTPGEAALQAARVEGATHERERIQAIMSLGEAKGREGAALSLALTTPVSAVVAAAVLATLPVAGAAAAEAQSGGRAKDAPMGLVIDEPVPRTDAGPMGIVTPEPLPRSDAALSALEVAARVNAGNRA